VRIGGFELHFGDQFQGFGLIPVCAQTPVFAKLRRALVPNQRQSPATGDSPFLPMAEARDFSEKTW
jgi:hypothetical protein